MRKTATGSFLSGATRDSDMKMEHDRALRRDHVCNEFGSREFAIELRVHLGNGERCEQCMVAIYDAIGRLARGALAKRQHRATQGEIEELQHEIYDLLTEKDCRRLQGYNPARGAFEAWLAAFVDHHLIDRHRKQHEEVSLDENSAAVRSPDPSQEAEYLNAERIEILRRAIAELSEHDRRLLDLCCDETLTAGDIAKTMGFKVEEVPWRKQRSLNRLRRAVLGSSKTFSKK